MGKINEIYKSNLTFHSVDLKFKYKDYRDIWSEYIQSPEKYRRSNTVIVSKFEPEFLVGLINLFNFNEGVMEQITDEYYSGFNYMFVGSIKNKPVYGYFLDDFDI